MPEELVDLLNRAQAEVRAEEFASAVHTCQLILRTNPTCLLALRLLAVAASQLGDVDVAAMSFRACSRIDPEDSVAHVGLALCAEAENDPATALAEFRRAAELSPDDDRIAAELSRRAGEIIHTPLMKARSELARGNASIALSILDREADSRDVAVELTRARAFWDLGRVDEVWDLCWGISKEHPSCVRALSWLTATGQIVEKPLYVRMIKKIMDQITPGIELKSPTLAPSHA